MRFLLAAAAAAAVLSAPLHAEPVAASTAPAAAVAVVPHPRPDVTDWFAGPFAPHMMAWDMDERGLPRYPFDRKDSYVNGAGSQAWARFAHQFTEGSREANHVDAGWRSQYRLAADFEYSKFRHGAFRFDKAADWLSMHGTADLSQSDLNTFEYGVGFATLQGDRSLWGLSVEFRYERKLSEPWTLYAKYMPNLMSDGRLWHQISLGAGPNWRNLGAEAGWRMLLNPLRDSYGPELSLRLWF